MKKKKLFLIIYISFVIITIIALIILSILGSKSRIGYLSNFKLNIERTLDLNNLSNIVTLELDIMIKFLEIAIFMAFIQIYLICPIT